MDRTCGSCRWWAHGICHQGVGLPSQLDMNEGCHWHSNSYPMVERARDLQETLWWQISKSNTTRSNGPFISEARKEQGA